MSEPLASSRRGFPLTRRHAVVFGGLLAVFSLLNFLGAHAIADDNGHWGQVVRATAATVLGPFTGSVASHNNGSANVRVAWSMMPYAGGTLAVGLILQFILVSPGRGWNWVRLTAWGFGWTVWLGFGLVSVLNALE